MTLVQAAILGVVQGLTEFLPVSSSAHLLLVPWFFGWKDPGLAFDVALHWGTLIALAVYFWREWAKLAAGVLRAIGERAWNSDAVLAAKLAVGTIPGGIAGFFLESYADRAWRSPWISAVMLALVGVVMWIYDRRAKNGDPNVTPGWGATILIGCAQAVAIIPGTSRSGSTMIAALAVGLPRSAAARFSFLLSGPIILAAGLKKLPGILHGDPATTAVGLVCAAISGGLAIAFLLRYLSRGSFAPFAIYRLLLAAGVVTLLLVRG
jgi:undecaprenyl-diphosphatase